MVTHLDNLALFFTVCVCLCVCVRVLLDFKSIPDLASVLNVPFLFVSVCRCTAVGTVFVCCFSVT